MDTWHGCYDDGWRGLIVDEAFAHPAKMSLGLTKRIFKHAFEQGWLKKGDTVLDPFGGIGSTAIVGTYEGVGVVCVELEPRFRALAQRNFELHRRKWERLGALQPTILQGDSRELLKLLQGADCIVGSPPYSEGLSKEHTYADHNRRESSAHRQIMLEKGIADPFYGQSPGQLASMKPGDVDAIVGSPPYAVVDPSQNSRSVDRQKQWETYRAQGGGSSFEAFAAQQAKHSQGYGSTPGNLASMKPGDVDAIVGSPPYEGDGRVGTIGNYKSPSKLPQKCGDLFSASGGKHRDYGETSGQLGHETGPTFWSAAREIMQQCHAVLKPGGMAVWVVKRFVRKGQLVDFPGDWLRLCEACGFTLVCRHQAMLTKETTEGHLFDGEVTKRKERKSFFRRLAERKGSPPIDWEDVLCLRREP